jgi:hypothetical protein
MKNVSPKFLSYLCFSILCISATYSQESETETPTIEQKEYVVEKVDSINKSKDAIYSSTKMFIAGYWRSAQSVIQNDDKEGGAILIKGSSTHKVSIGLGATLDFTYRYDVKFLMKEKRYKVVVENYKFERAPAVGWERYGPFLEPKEPLVYPGYRKAGIGEKQWNTLMSLIKSEMQGIVNNYVQHLQKEEKSNADW